MADRKISELTNITGANLADNDEFVVVDTSTDETKAITRAELETGIVNFDSVSAAGALMDNLEAIAESKAVTAVDVFVYDTSKDSDGGAWRKRTQHTSWYNETLNTATRGSRREFPAVAVIVAESNQVTIYDGDDPALPMWMVFNEGTRRFVPNYIGNGTLTSLHAINGVVCVGDTQNGVLRFLFLEDTATAIASAYEINWNRSIARRNDNVTTETLDSSTVIINKTVNDVAMTVLPNAPIDPATGLPVPTIAVATDGGVSVIKDDGTVWSPTGVGYVEAELSIKPTGVIGEFYGVASRSADPRKSAASGNTFYLRTKASGNGYTEFFKLNVLTETWTAIEQDWDSAQYASVPSYQPKGTQGLVALSPSPVFSDGMVAYTTSSYQSGWQNGDIKGAFLSDTDDTDLVGGTDNDRSVNGNDLTVNGTITRTPVATGADLVAYSGFSASNYLEQPYNSDLDFGTGDFCMMGWVNTADTSSQTIVETRDSGGAEGFALSIINQHAFLLTEKLGISSTEGAIDVVTGSWRFITAVVKNSGTTHEIYVDGKLDVSATVTARSIGGTDDRALIGKNHVDGNPLDGSLALLRISATAPTAEQIAKIYNDEKFLFQENAQATLYGSSDAVTALAHDDVTDLLHVGTSAGRSVFQGLRRVDNTTTAVSTAISASNGLVVEE